MWQLLPTLSGAPLTRTFSTRIEARDCTVLNVSAESGTHADDIQRSDLRDLQCRRSRYETEAQQRGGYRRQAGDGLALRRTAGTGLVVEFTARTDLGVTL